MLFGLFLIVFSLVAFSANAIQYGIDQLEYDARSETIVLYIYWYVWTCYIAEFIMKIVITFFGMGSYFINPFIFLVVLPIILGIGFCVKQCNLHFVNTQPQSDHPYKLIYQIIIFAVNHNSLMHLSSYNHNEALPNTRLDLAKERYGGPFTTNQVEAVKSFLRIFCILLTLGPVLMADIAVSQILPSLIPHMDRYPTYITVIAPNLGGQKYDALKSLTSSGALTPLVVVIALPIYICLLRPCLYNYIPGTLKRIGLGMVFIFLSALCTVLMDTAGHIQTAHKNVTTCFLNTNYYYDDPYYDNIVPILNISAYVLTIQSILNAIGYVLIYISMFEFICTQSPQSMKGILICSFFAIKGAFRLLGDLVLLAPFTRWNSSYAFPSCGFTYYLVNAVLVLAGIVVFTIAAKKYQYQGEPDYNEHYGNAEGYSSIVHGQNNPGFTTN